MNQTFQKWFGRRIEFFGEIPLAMNKNEFEEFQNVFWNKKLSFQTRPETINDYNMRKLKEVAWQNFFELSM